jgi:hypothetical protein
MEKAVAEDKKLDRKTKRPRGQICCYCTLTYGCLYMDSEILPAVE